MKFIAGFIVAGFLVASSVQSTPFTKCQDGPAPSDLRVDGCTKKPCLLERASNVTAEWDFTVTEDTAGLKPTVRVTVLGVTVDYPFPQKDACSTLQNTKCPLDAGEDVTYVLSMPILKAYPKIPLTIEFALFNDANKVVVCFAIDARIIDKSKSKRRFN